MTLRRGHQGSHTLSDNKILEKRSFLSIFSFFYHTFPISISKWKLANIFACRCSIFKSFLMLKIAGPHDFLSTVKTLPGAIFITFHPFLWPFKTACQPWNTSFPLWKLHQVLYLKMHINCETLLFHCKNLTRCYTYRSPSFSPAFQTCMSTSKE